MNMNLGKILYVDDDKLLTSTFTTLMKVEGFKDVVVFNNPIEAVEYLKIETPDLIISDFLMPEMNGLEFLREAKKLYPEISMILLTAYSLILERYSRWICKKADSSAFS